MKEENIEKSLKINKGITINENANIEASKEISLKEKGNISLKGKEKLNENKIIQIKPDEKEISSSSKKYDEDFDKNINLQTEIKESKGAKKGGIQGVTVVHRSANLDSKYSSRRAGFEYVIFFQGDEDFLYSGDTSSRI